MAITDQGPGQVSLAWPEDSLGASLRTSEPASEQNEHENLRMQRAAQSDQLDALKKELEVQGATVVRASVGLAEARRAVVQANSRADELAGEVGDLEIELERLSTKVVRLETELATRKDELESVVRSRSWRFTAPLRRFARFVRRVLLDLPALLGLSGRVSVHLVPLQGVQATLGTPGEWAASNGDPQFTALGMEVAAGHWVDFRLELAGEAAKWAVPKLYIDQGSGASEATAIVLPRPAGKDGKLSLIFPLPADTRAVRFDPIDRPGLFTVSVPDVVAMGRLRAAWRVWRELSAMRRTGLVMQVFRDGTHTSSRCESIAFRLKAALMGAYVRAKRRETGSYQDWIDEFEPDASEFRRLREVESKWPNRPQVSVILTVERSSSPLLQEVVSSVRRQLYPSWELCIGSAARKGDSATRFLEDASKADSRIRVAGVDGNASACRNAALDLARGDYVALIDCEDLLHPLALHFIAEAIQGNPRAAVIYSDEDKVSETGERSDPHFKPEFNYSLFLSHNMVSRLSAYRVDLVRQLGGFRDGFDGAYDYDLSLRCLELEGAAGFIHVPRVLYHRRGVTDASPPSQAAALRAVSEHFERLSVRAAVVEAPEAPGMNRVRYLVPDPPPSVCIIIPTRDRLDLLQVCVDSVLDRTEYSNYSVCVVDNGSQEPQTLAYLKSLPTQRVSVIRDDGPFNFSALNNRAALATKSDLLCLMNNDIEVVDGNWLVELVGHAIQPGVGAVGARLWYPDGGLQHGGVILGLGGIACHAHTLLGRGQPSYFHRAAIQQEFSAVTGACLVVRRAVYEEVDGLDEQLRVAFNDIDFCLRLRERGYRNVWTPYAELIHHESASRGQESTPEKRARFESEVAFMERRWGRSLLADPAYSPNLALSGMQFSLAWPPRISASH